MKRILTALLLPASVLAAPAPSAPTFNRDVAPIIFKSCSGCHRPGEVAPFSLLSYKDTVRKAETIAKVVRRQVMPPWKAEPQVHAFLDERRLSEAEIDTIVRWVDGGQLEGDAKDLPPLPKFADGWQLGEPDLVLTFPEDVTIPADGRDVFRCIVIPTGVLKDKTVAAVEFRPGNRLVVHHALFFLDTSGKARKLDEADPEPGYRSFGGVGFTPSGALGGWAPGATPRFLPEGVGRMLKAKSDLVVQMHYHPSGKVEKDRSTLGVYFTKTPAEKIIAGIPLGNRQIRIEPGEKRHLITNVVTLPVGVTVIGLTPHMHWIGKEMTVTAVLPDGRREQMINIKDWDFNWQDQYLYKTPVHLPSGTKLELHAYYDNSAENPKNPQNPPKLVTFGEQTSNEMCFCFLNVVPDTKWGYLQLLKLAVDNLGPKKKPAPTPVN
jgi:mono/diheme cytochrome c family protein